MQVEEALERLSGSRQRFLASLEGLDDAGFARVPAGETWSPAHVVEHLVRVEGRITRGARIVIEKGSDTRPGRFDALRRLPLRLRVVDLVRVRTVPGADPALDPPAPLARVPQLEHFAVTRAETVALLESVRERDLAGRWLRHPFFGAFTIPDMMAWVAWHEDRHRRQVERLRRRR
jgi:hypothetical protein